MLSPHLAIEEQDGLLRLTLRRLDRQNALDAPLCQALQASLQHAEREAAIQVVLLQAEGKVFSAGFEPEEQNADAERTALFEAGQALRKPLVVAVGGPAVGAGTGLTALADIALCAQGVSFGVIDMRHKRWPHWYWKPLVAAIGERRARELALSGRVFGTPDALQMGLVHQVHPAFELDDRVEETLQRLLGYPPEVLANCKARV